VPRNNSGAYSLPVGSFTPGALIKSADFNSDLQDIATALTQSLATTGVSTMTGALIGAAGLVTTPGYTFNGATKTGLYLAGANQIGVATNGIQAVTFNSDQSVTIAGTISAAKGTIPIGTGANFYGTTAPSGWLLCFGQLVSTTTYAALFAVLSTTYGSGAGTFGIPDCRGRADFGQDNMGGSAANRITATTNYDGTVLGNSGGGQATTLITGNLPAYTPSGTNSSIGVSVTASGLNLANYGGGNPGLTSSASLGSADITSITSSGTVGGQTFTGNAQGGSSTAFTNLPPSIIANKIIFAGV
jgi:microcystin-dependent protein